MKNLMNNSESVFDDLPIGTKVIWVEDVELEVRPGGSCSGCYFNFCMGRCRHFICSSTERKDNKDIIFVRI